MGDEQIKELSVCPDEEMLVIKGPYTGHIAIVKKRSILNWKIMIIAKNPTNSNKVKVLEVFTINGEKPRWLIPLGAH